MSMAVAAVDDAPIAVEIENFENHFENHIKTFNHSVIYSSS